MSINLENSMNVISPESLKTEYVSPETCVFSLNKSGFLCAEIDGKQYGRVILTRCLPLNFPLDYICISDIEKNELGIIEHVAAFSAEQQEFIKSELEQRYYCPSVSKITAIKEKMGNFYFDVEIGSFKKSFTVKDVSKSIRSHGNSIYITDLDGNRYKIDNFDSIPPKSRRLLEPYMY